MIATDYEATHFYRLFHVLLVLCEGNRTIHELTPFELQEIEAISESQSRVSVHAQSILAGLNVHAYTRVAERTNQNSGMITNNSSGDGRGEATIQEVNSNLSVYPNPSEGKITIEVKHEKAGNIVVSDVLGRIHFEAEIKGNEIEKITTSLHTGVYIVKFTSETGFIETKQVFIQN